MKYNIAIAILILLCISWNALGRVPELELTDSNFNSLVANSCENEDWVVVFLADWCQVCVSFKSELHRFSIESPALKKVDNIHVGLVDVAENPGLTSRFMVFHVPSIYHGKSNAWRTLQNHRSYDNLTNYFVKEEWNETQPRLSFFGPCSTFGTCLEYLGYMGGGMVRGYEYMHQNYPPWIMYLIFVALIFLPAFMLLVLFRDGESRRSAIIKKSHNLAQKDEKFEPSVTKEHEFASVDKIHKKKSNKRIE